MKGHVPTPEDLAKKMVRRLFRDAPPTSADRILYPGCGTAPFAAAVERVCESEGGSTRLASALSQIQSFLVKHEIVTLHTPSFRNAISWLTKRLT